MILYENMNLKDVIFKI